MPMQWEADLRHRNMAAPWRDIGAMIWEGGQARLELPGIDLEALTRNPASSAGAN